MTSVSSVANGRDWDTHMRKVIRGSFVAGVMAIGLSAVLAAAAADAPVAEAAARGDKAAI